MAPEMWDLCSKEFEDEVSLRTHRDSKHLKTKHECLMCGLSTKNVNFLKNHLKSHLGARQYVCPICKKCFGWKSSHKTHIKTIHVNMYSFCCQICGKQFKHKTSLSVHNKSQHTGERQFLCSKCPKTFVEARWLRDHMKWHLLQENKEKRQYCCHLCNNRLFLDKTCLSVHTSSAHCDDKPHMCHVCGKGFKLKNCLRAHTLTHSEERPYYCEVCDGAFKSKKDLKKHQERHKSSKDHVCETCGKTFVTRNDVYLHQKVHDPTRQHRLYMPGKYKVSGGELLTACTRKNKLHLKEQEPISFDTEINGTTSLGSKKISQEKDSTQVTTGDFLIKATRSSPCSTNEILSNESLKFETFLDTSDDSNEFHLKTSSLATSPADRYLISASDSKQETSSVSSSQKLEMPESWNSVESLEDYDWLDAASSQGSDGSSGQTMTVES